MRVEPARVGGLELSSSSFQLVDDTTFAGMRPRRRKVSSNSSYFLVLGRYRCKPNEEITSLVSLVSGTENQEHCLFCLGTFIYSPEEMEPSSGSLLIFKAIPDALKKPNLNLSILTSAKVQGCVYALRVVGNNIVAAINSAVSFFQRSFPWYAIVLQIDTTLPSGLVE